MFAFKSFFLCLRSVAGLVIQATGRTEFDDGLRTGVLLGDCWCPWGGRTYPRINFKPLWGCGLVLVWVWLSEGPHFRPNSNLLGSAHCIGGIKLQLLCGVRIEPAKEVGSLFVSQDWPGL